MLMKGFDEQGLCVPVTGFDYDSVDGEEAAIREKLMPVMAEFLRSVTEWATLGQRGQFRGKGMRVRFVVATWIMYPGLYGDVSQREIAARLRVARSKVDGAVSSFIKRFGVKRRRNGKAGRWVFVWGK